MFTTPGKSIPLTSRCANLSKAISTTLTCISSQGCPIHWYHNQINHKTLKIKNKTFQGFPSDVWPGASMYSCSKLWYHEYGFGLWVVEADDSFACLTRLSSIGGCGLAETVGLGFVLTPTVLRLSPSWISCVCCWCFVLFPSVLGNHKQHCSWSWIDAMVSLISRWILSLVMLTG